MTLTSRQKFDLDLNQCQFKLIYVNIKKKILRTDEHTKTLVRNLKIVSIT